MADDNQILRKEEVLNLFKVGSVEPLDDLQLTEDLALSVQQMMDKIEFYKDHKKKKNDLINSEISKIEGRITFLKRVMFETLQKHKEKNCNFPGSCRVSARAGKPKWVIADEEAFLEIAEKEKELDNIAEKIVSYKIDKKAVDKLLVAWEKSNKFPEGILNDKGEVCVKKEPAIPSVTLTFFNQENTEDQEFIAEDSTVEEMDYL